MEVDGKLLNLAAAAEITHIYTNKNSSTAATSVLPVSCVQFVKYLFYFILFRTLRYY